MVPRALTIAGSDSGGGAGIQADLKTFFAHGVHGMSAITALTAQNTVGVHGVHEVPADFVRAQIDAVVSDIGVDAVKTGMLASASIIEVVADAIRSLELPNVVCDPVLVSKHGDPLLRSDAVDVLRSRMLPLVSVLTPNVPEAEALLGHAVGDDPDETARELVALGPRWALLKGGHREGDDAVDVLTDGDRVVSFAAPRIPTPHTHGTGCALSAAIAANLAKGLAVTDAVDAAKRFVWSAIERHLRIGSGVGAVNPGYDIWRG